MLWNPEQSDRDLVRGGTPCIASEARLPGETRVGTLCTGEQRGSDGWRSSVRAISWLCLDLYALVAEQMDAGASVNPATPVLPEERSRTNRHRMEQDAHLARLYRCAAIPLALLA